LLAIYGSHVHFDTDIHTEAMVTETTWQTQSIWEMTGTRMQSVTVIAMHKPQATNII
jgi:hypothetical protein